VVQVWLLLARHAVRILLVVFSFSLVEHAQLHPQRGTQPPTQVLSLFQARWTLLALVLSLQLSFGPMTVVHD
jgi:hypothetical protein